MHKDTSTLPALRVGGGIRSWSGREPTSYFVLLALLVCAAELFLANRIYRTSNEREKSPARRAHGEGSLNGKSGV